MIEAVLSEFTPLQCFVGLLFVALFIVLSIGLFRLNKADK